MSAPSIARPTGADPARKRSAADRPTDAHPAGPGGPVPHRPVPHQPDTRRPALLRRPRRRSWWVDAVGLAAWASLLFVVVLWERAGGLQDLIAGTGSALTSAGRLTGLVSADLLLLQVLAMARIPMVERAVGQDRLAKWHRLAGFTSFNLMAAHIVLITLGYAAIAGTGPLGELWSLITTAPGMLLATAGTAALIAVVVTPVRAARRRLRYESWHLLHLHAYLGGRRGGLATSRARCGSARRRTARRHAHPVEAAPGEVDADDAGRLGANVATTTTAPVTASYTGDVVLTRFGPVQVEITVTDGAVTDAVATQYPSDDQKSLQINAYALPTLESETVSAQSASIDLVSGATITSNAYVQSLQSALDQAQL